MKKNPLKLVQFSFNTKDGKMAYACQKYGWKTATYLEIINMDEKDIPYVHPYSFAVLQNKRNKSPKPHHLNPLFVNLAATFPDKVMKNLNIYQLSVFSKSILENYSYEILEFLKKKYKNTKIDYNPDMNFYLYEENPAELIKEVIKSKKASEKLIKAATIKKDLSVFRSLQMISAKDVARIWKFRFPNAQWTAFYQKLLEYIKDFEIKPQDISSEFYQTVKEETNNILCDFNKINEYTFKGYKGKKQFEDMNELVTYKELFRTLVKKGFLSTDSKEENAIRFLYLRYDYFPHLTLPDENGYNLYFLSEIEEIVQNIEKTGIIPIETSYDLLATDERHPVCPIDCRGN